METFLYASLVCVGLVYGVFIGVYIGKAIKNGEISHE